MAKLDFSYLVAPLTAADFFDNYWQKAALAQVCSRADMRMGRLFS
jgi:hypothetical protein